jgi:hypothetical protein
VNQTVRNLLVGAAAVLPLVVIASGGYYWMSAPQRLKRACWDTTLKSLVAPSTAKLIDFRLLQPGASDSPIEIKLAAKVTTATRHMAEVHDEYDAAEKKRDELGNRILARQYVVGDDTVSQWRAASADAEDMSIKSTRATVELDAARKELDEYRARKWAEIVMQVDAQNRASALLRSEAVCVYVVYPGDASRSISTVTLAQFEGR